MSAAVVQPARASQIDLRFGRLRIARSRCRPPHSLSGLLDGHLACHPGARAFCCGAPACLPVQADLTCLCLLLPLVAAVQAAAYLGLTTCPLCRTRASCMTSLLGSLRGWLPCLRGAALETHFADMSPASRELLLSQSGPHLVLPAGRTRHYRLALPCPAPAPLAPAVALGAQAPALAAARSMGTVVAEQRAHVRRAHFRRARALPLKHGIARVCEEAEAACGAWCCSQSTPCSSTPSHVTAGCELGRTPAQVGLSGMHAYGGWAAAGAVALSCLGSRLTNEGRWYAPWRGPVRPTPVLQSEPLPKQAIGCSCRPRHCWASIRCVTGKNVTRTWDADRKQFPHALFVGTSCVAHPWSPAPQYKCKRRIAIKRCPELRKEQALVVSFLSCACCGRLLFPVSDLDRSHRFEIRTGAAKIWRIWWPLRTPAARAWPDCEGHSVVGTGEECSIENT